MGKPESRPVKRLWERETEFCDRECGSGKQYKADKEKRIKGEIGGGQWAMWVLTALYGAACLYLYYMQSVQPLDYDNRYFQSDLPYHISMIVEDGWYYSFTAYAYQALYYLCGRTTVGIALFLAAVTVASLLLTELLLRRMAGMQRKSWATMAAALALNLVMPFT